MINFLKNNVVFVVSSVLLGGLIIGVSVSEKTADLERGNDNSAQLEETSNSPSLAPAYTPTLSPILPIPRIQHSDDSEERYED